MNESARISLVIAVLLGLLSGCLGGQTPTSKLAPSPDLTNDSTAVDATPAANLSRASVIEPSPRSIPVDFNGSFPQFVEGCVEPVVCTDLPPSASFRNVWGFSLPSLAQGGSVVLTWNATSEAMTNLGVSLFAIEGGRQLLAKAWGPSPLVLAFPKFTGEVAGQYELFVSAPSTGVTGVAYVAANPVDQPFHLVGSIPLRTDPEG